MGKDDFLGGHMEVIYYEAALLAQREHMVQVGHVNQISLVIPAPRANYLLISTRSRGTHDILQ